MKWASYLQQFHLVIKYKKGAHNQVTDFLSRPPICTLLSVLDTKCSCYTEWCDLYSTDPDLGPFIPPFKHCQVSTCNLSETTTLRTDSFVSFSNSASL
eukprot:Gb_20748 [translate_table: standard]